MQENSYKISMWGLTANLHEIVKKVKFHPQHNLVLKEISGDIKQ